MSMTSQQGITDLISLSSMIEAPAQDMTENWLDFGGEGDQLWGVGDKKRKPVGGLPPD